MHEPSAVHRERLSGDGLLKVDDCRMLISAVAAALLVAPTALAIGEPRGDAAFQGCMFPVDVNVYETNRCGGCVQRAQINVFGDNECSGCLYTVQISVTGDNTCKD